MVIGPGEMVYPTVYFRIWIAGTFCTELEYGPISTMLPVEEGNQLIGGIAVCFFRPY